MTHAIASRRTSNLGGKGLSRVLPQIQALIESSRRHVVSTANLTLVWLNWNVGRIITQDIQQNQKRATPAGSCSSPICSALPSKSPETQIPSLSSGSEGRLTIDFTKHQHLGWTHYRILLGVEAGLNRGFYCSKIA